MTPTDPCSTPSAPLPERLTRDFRGRAVAALLLAFAPFLSLRAQTGASPADPDNSPSHDQAVVLPSFNVQSEKDRSYEGSESVSLTRTGVPLADIPQSISIINRSYIDDVSPTGINWMVQYIGGGQVGNLPMYETTDRFVLRGFTSQGDFVDGFLMVNAEAATTNLIDHMEIVKGPAAIMSTNATGAIGGAVNKVSVSPTANETNTLSLEYGRFDAEQANLDVGGAITKDGKFLGRLLIDAADQKGYFQYQYLKRFDVVPMLRYVFSDTTEVWVKAEIEDNHYGSYNGLPLDGRTNAPIAVPIKTNFDEDSPENFRHGFPMYRIWGQFTTRPNDHIAIRFAVQDSVLRIFSTESELSPTGATAPTLQPNGTYAYTPYPQYSLAPTYVNGTSVARLTAATFTDTPHREIQNDYAINFKTGPISHKLLIGEDIADMPAITKSWSNGGSSTASSSPINPFSPTHPGTVLVNYSAPPVSDQDLSQTYAKVFALETVGLFDDRILLSYGVSRHRFDESSVTYTYNQVTNTAGATSYVPDSVLYKNLVQYGFVVKPVKNISVFYGQNSNFTANPIQNGSFLPPQQGAQYEMGVKADIIPNRLNISVSYFDIYQINNTVPAFPQTQPQTQVLIPGETSRGFDGDFTFEITKNLALVGSFAALSAHVQEAAPYNLAPQPYNGKIYQSVPVNNVSQDNFAAVLRYRFTDFDLQGLTVFVASTTLSKRAITDGTNQIFYGYLPGYTLFNLGTSYETRHYKIQLNLDNVTDKSYWFASRSQNMLFPGTPINPRVTLTYKF